MLKRRPKAWDVVYILASLLVLPADGFKSFLTGAEAAASSRRQTPERAEAAASSRPEQAVGLRTLVLRRAREQLTATMEAEMESKVNAKSMLAAQQQLVAQMAEDAAEDSSQIDSESIPDVKEALAETRGWAIEAQLHAKHVKATERAFLRLPQEAAEAAAAKIREQLRSEAYAAAEQASVKVAAEAPAKHAQKVVESVAASMEPYHLALLRSQKTAAEDEVKARSAARSSARLEAEAERLAKKAQALQAAGLGVQARQTMSIAHVTSEQSVGMRKWAVSLHLQAGKLQSGLMTLEDYERQAAEHAARNVGEAVVPILPTQPPSS